MWRPSVLQVQVKREIYVNKYFPISSFECDWECSKHEIASLRPIMEYMRCSISIGIQEVTG